MTSTELKEIIEKLQSPGPRMTGVKDTIQALSGAAMKKGKAGVDRILITGFLAGAFIALGSYLALVTGGNLGADYGDGIKKLLFAAVFPIGIILVIFLETDLFTGNTLILPLGALENLWSFKLSTLKYFYYLPKVWFFCYIGNVLGGVFVAFFLVYLTNDVHKAKESLWGQKAVSIAESKMEKEWYQLLFSSIGANWLVCCSVFMGAQCKDGISKLLALWWPIFAFVAMGWEHCIANSFFIPLGIFYGAEHWYKIFYNLALTTTGNIIGGSFFTAFILWYTVHRNEPKVRETLSLKHIVKKIVKRDLENHKDDEEELPESENTVAKEIKKEEKMVEKHKPQMIELKEKKKKKDGTSSSEERDIDSFSKSSDGEKTDEELDDEESPIAN